jgi:hypothetical protein
MQRLSYGIASARPGVRNARMVAMPSAALLNLWFAISITCSLHWL